ncbi:MAG: homocysteine S-methyltransferase family protein [Prevotella sp.]|nr:homocysteine S-methyltransferase family protein [Prevotella sp.]
MTWKTNLEETKHHYMDWWDRKGVIVNMWEHFQERVTPHADIPKPEQPDNLDQQWFDPQWRARYLDWYVAHSSLKADILPVANTQLGPGSLAAILGGVFEGGEDTIWIHPAPDFDDAIPFDKEHPNYLLHKQLLRACKERAKGNYYVGMPDLMEGLDVLAALKGTDQVLMDTVMRPEVVERQMQRINDIYFEVFDELYDIIREGDEMAFCYFSAWAPGKMSKLQSDISTMVSEDDYRRFVQPFIREQCRRIDYTLYHLDGVGAMRHLPAILEIEELDAIQWTPGVGEPQGGNAKWYGLYRQILEAGKSLMCCWVQLDELPALLDHIGTEGVHLEMDFHNEQEVEQALEIVEKAKAAAPKAMSVTPPCSLPDSFKSLKTSETLKTLETLNGRILILDGAMGTMIQQHHLQEEDFRGDRFKDVEGELKGCNDLLCLTRPNVIEGIHRKYLEAGADLIETCTFNAQRISLADYGVEDCAREVNLAACRIARGVAEEFSRLTPQKPRFVLGSVGPTSGICSPEATSGVPLDQHLLRRAYEEQMAALLDGGVDGILIETIFDTLNARIAIEAAIHVMKEKGKELPLLLSFSVSSPDGHNMLGQDILACIDTLMDNPDIRPHLYSVGINCLADVPQMTPLVMEMGRRFGCRVSLYPNAGMPDAQGRYSKTAESLLADVWPLIDGHHLNIIGGCCGTSDRNIRAFAQAIEPAKGLFISPHPSNPRKTSAPRDTSAPSAPRDPRKTSAPGATLYDAILGGRDDEAAAATKTALEEGKSPQDLIENQMIAAMTELGRQFQEGKAFVPQLLMAGRAMKAALAQIKMTDGEAQVRSRGRVVIGTVKGDLHDIGKNLVAAMLEGCGFEVVNVGIDVSAGQFVEAIKKHHPDLLCMSALLTTTMGYMKEVIDTLEKAGLRQKVKIMVGGAPVTQRFADEIGADGYSDNANSAVILAKQLMAVSK